MGQSAERAQQRRVARVRERREVVALMLQPFSFGRVGAAAGLTQKIAGRGRDSDAPVNSLGRGYDARRRTQVARAPPGRWRHERRRSGERYPGQRIVADQHGAQYAAGACAVRRETRVYVEISASCRLPAAPHGEYSDRLLGAAHAIQNLDDVGGFHDQPVAHAIKGFEHHEGADPLIRQAHLLVEHIAIRRPNSPCSPCRECWLPAWYTASTLPGTSPSRAPRLMTTT